MLVTELEIVTSIRLEQPSNAEIPIFVTELGMTMFVRPEQPEYLQPVITQYFVRNKSEI